jgi:hypothetical protein
MTFDRHVIDGQECLIWTCITFDSWYFANPTLPFIRTGRCVAAGLRLAILPTLCIADSSQTSRDIRKVPIASLRTAVRLSAAAFHFAIIPTVPIFPQPPGLLHVCSGSPIHHPLVAFEYLFSKSPLFDHHILPKRLRSAPQVDERQRYLCMLDVVGSCRNPPFLFAEYCNS